MSSSRGRGFDARHGASYSPAARRNVPRVTKKSLRREARAVAASVGTYVPGPEFPDNPSPSFTKQAQPQAAKTLLELHELLHPQKPRPPASDRSGLSVAERFKRCLLCVRETFTHMDSAGHACSEIPESPIAAWNRFKDLRLVSQEDTTGEMLELLLSSDRPDVARIGIERFYAPIWKAAMEQEFGCAVGLRLISSKEAEVAA